MWSLYLARGCVGSPRIFLDSSSTFFSWLYIRQTNVYVTHLFIKALCFDNYTELKSLSFTVDKLLFNIYCNLMFFSL